MSSLWTPSGEHPVDRPGESTSSSPRSRGATAPPTGSAAGNRGEATQADLSPEERAQAEALAKEIEESRRQLLQAPAGPVVGQQALQFYELAALHLSQPQPKLSEARVAIDAFAAVIDKLGSRLAEAESPLRQALNQIQLAFVEASRSASGQSGAGAQGSTPGNASSAESGSESGSGSGTL
jgi:hypothetical protein